MSDTSKAVFLSYASQDAEAEVDADADAMLAQMIKVNGDVGAFQIAEIYGFRGDKDQAIAWLERARRQRDAGIVVFTNDPFFNSLRSDPRWAEFRRKLGLPVDQPK